MHIGRTPNSVAELRDIPFLPIEFFKTQKIYFGEKQPEMVFKSSGTTNTKNRSSHFIDSAKRYRESIRAGFTNFFSDEKLPLKLFALLPGYLENDESSLIYMIEALKDMGLVELKGYYLRDYEKLYADIQAELSGKSRVVLCGVSFALLDFLDLFQPDLSGHIVMETGGMKGRRRELLRSELHDLLQKGFNVNQVYSEYGMTELMSQAYSKGKGIFTPSPTMGILVRDVYDPFTIVNDEASGALNIIDLSNKYSCSFIATQDLGRVFSNGNFEVLGRTDHSDVRGCNLMAI